MLTSCQRPALESAFSSLLPPPAAPHHPHSCPQAAALLDGHHRHHHHHQICCPQQPPAPSRPCKRQCASAPVAPSDHLQFFWWPTSTEGHKRAPGREPQEENMEVVQPEEDLRRLVDNDLKLRLSGYYYGSLGWVEASEMLKKCAPGTFLVRDSEHASYLYSLSVQTTRGPTSCRVDYHRGRFRLDSPEPLCQQMPRFESMPQLVDHYVRLTSGGPPKGPRKGPAPVWLDLADGKQDVPVQMYRPLYRATRSLQHLCRVRLVQVLKETRPHASLERTVDEQARQGMPTVLRDYLKEYPYSQ